LGRQPDSRETSIRQIDPMLRSYDERLGCEITVMIRSIGTAGARRHPVAIDPSPHVRHSTLEELADR
jgi:hypothetical protein